MRGVALRPVDGCGRGQLRSDAGLGSHQFELVATRGLGCDIIGIGSQLHHIASVKHRAGLGVLGVHDPVHRIVGGLVGRAECVGKAGRDEDSRACGHTHATRGLRSAHDASL